MNDYLANIKYVNGPYKQSNSGRFIINTMDFSGRKRTISYPKFLVEVLFGEPLDSRKETVDHIDHDWENNSWDNLRVVPMDKHAREDGPTVFDIAIDRGIHIYTEAEIMAAVPRTPPRKSKNERRSRVKKVLPSCAACERPVARAEGRFCSYACKNKAMRKVSRPPAAKLAKLVWKYPTVQLAKQLGVSDSAIGKWCRQYGIKKPPRGYWAKNRQ